MKIKFGIFTSLLALFSLAALGHSYVLIDGTSNSNTVGNSAISLYLATHPSGNTVMHRKPTFKMLPLGAFYAVKLPGDHIGVSHATSAPNYDGPIVSNTIICSGSAATLTATGYNMYSWFDSNGTFLATGATFVTPALYTTTTYYVSADDNGTTTPRSVVTVTVASAPQAPTVTTPPPICAGSTVNLHADVASGQIDWFDVPTGGISLITSPDFTTPALTQTTTYYAEVNDGCKSTRTPVTITVKPIIGAPAVAPVPSVCAGSSATISVTSTGATYVWYNKAIGGTVLFTGATFTTPALTRSTVFYVDASNGTCEGERTAVNVNVLPAPKAPTAEDAVICSGSAATLVATDKGGIHNWYTTATGGNPIFTGDTLVTPPISSATTYYVDATSATGCTGPRTAVTVSNYATVPPPTAPGVTICAGTSATLTASGANNYQWYDAATGGNKLSDAQVFITSALTVTTTYYVQTTSNCPGTRTAVTVTVTPLPSAPVLGGTTSVCAGTTATLTANAGGTVNWYDAVIGGSLLFTGNTYTTPPLNQTTTYYADNTSGSCTSARTAITVNITAVANPQFQYPTATVCAATSNISPTVNNPAGGTFSVSPTGLVFVSTTTGEINVAASLPGTYTITFMGNGPCLAVTRTTFKITATTNPTFTYGQPEYCQTDASPAPIFGIGASAGVFSASPSGLVFVDPTTGVIDLVNSTPGTYSVINTILGSGACANNTSAPVTVTIYAKTVVSAGPNQQVAVNAPVQLTGSVTGAVTTGTWSGGNGTFSNASDLGAVYTPAPGENSATLTLTSADPPGPCGPQSAAMTVTFGSSSTPPPPPGGPAAPTASGQSICSGNTATLSATAPGGTYQWYNSASGGTAIATGPIFTTPSLTASTTYYVSTIINGVESSRTAVVVNVSAAPIVAPVTICAGATAVLTVSNPVAGYSYEWFSSTTSTTPIALGITFTTHPLNANTTYYVDAVSSGGGCTSTRTPVTVKVSPVPTITSADNDNVCSGMPLNYTIKADTLAATFTWSRAAVNGISNPAVNGQTSGTINETLINTTGVPIEVVYSITASNNSCPSTTFNYTVTVYPAPGVTSASSSTICNNTSSGYAVAFNVQAAFSWSRAAVTGINNAAVSGQTAPTIYELLSNSTNAPVKVTYVFDYTTGLCAGTPFSYVVTVNPWAKVTSPGTGTACSGIPQSYAIQSNVSSATFTWSRAAVAGISNTAVSNQTSGTITEALVNTGTSPVDVVYTIVPAAFGCKSPPFTYTVRVYPIPATPVAGSNSPVCINSTIHLSTPTIAGATYLWTGPDNFISSSQNPDINSLTFAKAGTYALTVTVNNCLSTSGSVNVVIDSLSIVNAGPDQTVCETAPLIQLNGSVTGGTTTGVWTSAGTGTFSPSNNNLDAQYLPSAADKAAGKVTLILTSVSKDDCAPATDQVVITFGPIPATDAGPSQTVCSQTTAVQLHGKLFLNSPITWSTSGDGTFDNTGDLNTNYHPGPKDIAAGKTVLSLLANATNVCYIPSSQDTIYFSPPPIITMASTRYVLKGHQVTLTPTFNEPIVSYQWTPNVNIDNSNVKSAVITGDSDTTYTLTVTDALGCVSSKSVRVIVSPQINVPNTFTPNGDGVNDIWEIIGLEAYQNVNLSIFNRYGTLIMQSIGYPKAWDGTYGGKQVPAGVYYYKIDLKVNGQVLAGSLTVLR